MKIITKSVVLVISGLALLSLIGCGVSKEDHAKVVSELETTKAALQKAQAKIDEQQKSILAIPKIDPGLEEKLKAAQQKIGDLTATFERLTSENGDLVAKLKGITLENGDLTAKLKGLVMENGDLSTKLKGLSLENSDLNSKLMGLSGENKKLSEQKAKLETTIGDLQEKLSALQGPAKGLPVDIFKAR